MLLTIIMVGLVAIPALWDIIQSLKSLQLGKRELWGRTFAREEAPTPFFAINFIAIALEVFLVIYVVRFYLLPNKLFGA